MCSMWFVVRASVLMSFGALVSWFGRLLSASLFMVFRRLYRIRKVFSIFHCLSSVR
jgi:hypothetical protein